MSGLTGGPAVGVVLCGGSSRRMGADKALLGSPPWALRVADALERAGCRPVVLLGGDPALADHGLPFVADDEPGGGPLRALPAVARRWPGREMVVAACDLPDLTAEDVTTLRRAAARPGEGPRATAYLLDGAAQWSLFVLDAAAAGAVRGLVEDGHRALRALAPWCTTVAGEERGTVRDVDDAETARRRGLAGPWDPAGR